MSQPDPGSVPKQQAPDAPEKAADEKSPGVPGALATLGPLKQRLESEIRPLLERTAREQDLGRAVDRVLSVVQQELYQGPLPHPAHFERFELAVPGSASRILKMAESEQQHRQTWENRALKFEFAYSVAGLVFGFIVAAGLIVAGVVTADNGHDSVGVAFVAASAVGMVAAFIKGREIFGKKGGGAQHQPAPASSSQEPMRSRKPKPRR